MTVKNATELVVLIENTLGWVPDETVPLWKARAIQAGRLNRAIRKDPVKLTWRNLELAVELLRRRRQPIKGPLFVIHMVDEALKEAAAPVVAQPLGDLIDAAIAREESQRALGWEAWVGRLARASGSARAEVHAEWLAERG